MERRALYLANSKPSAANQPAAINTIIPQAASAISSSRVSRWPRKNVAKNGTVNGLLMAASTPKPNWVIGLPWEANSAASVVWLARRMLRHPARANSAAKVTRPMMSIASRRAASRVSSIAASMAHNAARPAPVPMPSAAAATARPEPDKLARRITRRFGPGVVRTRAYAGAKPVSRTSRDDPDTREPHRPMGWQSAQHDTPSHRTIGGPEAFGVRLVASIKEM